MSEEILKALMQLFAIIAKQEETIAIEDRQYVYNFLKQQLNESAINEYIKQFDEYAEIKVAPDGQIIFKEATDKRISVKDSVRTLKICRQINKQLTQKQKVVVLVRLYEMIKTEKKLTEKRLTLLNTIADVFNICEAEKNIIESFVIHDDIKKFDSPNLMLIHNWDDNHKISTNRCKRLQTEKLDGSIVILHISSIDLYFLRYIGQSEVFLNGLPINNQRIYLFASGGVIKILKDKPIFYTDVVEKFLLETLPSRFYLEVKDVEYRFSNNQVGIRDINFSLTSGKLMGIMGASGTGKTTLLNVIAGIEKPFKGSVLLNGMDIHKNIDKFKGTIGYVSQDDLLIEELTVFQNLYYAAKLCLSHRLTEEEIIERVHRVLANLGLSEIKDLKVGSVLNRKISSGERKRLNIGLELIREPLILLVDEPTSGLSSPDAEKVVEILRQIALKGKLVIAVIHQPSSEIYRMFDDVLFLDYGGYMVYYGNPIEAVIYFKKLDNQINSNIGECYVCGSVNPETIFNIIEAQVVDEYGVATGKRKVEPAEWAETFKKIHQQITGEIQTKTAINLPDTDRKIEDKISAFTDLPNKFTQFTTYFIRDALSKLSNLQYVIINLIEAPLIALILAGIIRYTTDIHSDKYIFRENDNIPPYIFMCVIVAVFIGLTVSAEEIFKDRKILKREALLNLSRRSYLLSKVAILFIISAIQMFLFVIIGNWILGLKGMTIQYWLVLFTITASSNLMGLNISSAFNSAVTIYILIPLLIIPQMILGGAMFPFEKLNRILGNSNNVPFIAELIPSRWAYESLMVHQFKNNKYEKQFYKLDKIRSICNYKTVYFLPELENIVRNLANRKELASGNFSTSDSLNKFIHADIQLLQNELRRELHQRNQIKFNYIDSITVKSFNPRIADSTLNYIQKLKNYYCQKYIQASEEKNKIINQLIDTPEKKRKLEDLYNNYSNDYLSKIVKNTLSDTKIIRRDNRLIQKVDPIFSDPVESSFINSHFFAPRKPFLAYFVDTFIINISIIWLFTIFLYITLYFDWLRKIIMLLR